ncbi:hypothetical protein ACET9P_22090 [Aeromonas veronii]
MKLKILLALLILNTNNVFANDCNISSLLSSMNIKEDVKTVFQLKAEMRKLHGGGLYNKLFDRYLEEVNPYFRFDGPLDINQVVWAKKFIDDGFFNKMKKAARRVGVNPSSNVDIHNAEYAIGRELARLDDVFISNKNTIYIKVIATDDNVTTYWTHLDGVQVRGHPTGVTWNTIEGAGAPDNEVELVIALKKNGNGQWALPEVGNHGSKNIVLHEYGHAIDKIAGKAITSNGNKFSLEPDFYQAWYNEYISGNLKESYYTQAANNYEAALEESFAEGFAKYFSGDGVSHAEWPYISSYFKNILINRLMD